MLTVVIATRNRHVLLEGAVDSALGQTLEDVEVVVVDDASEPPVALASRPRLHTIRNPAPLGLSGARNVGLQQARGRWVTFLDDDDRLKPEMAAVSLDALRRTRLPPPVAVISGVEIVRAGRVVERRIPPTHPRGDHFPLEQPPPRRSHMTKHSLVVDRDLLRGLGGFDEALATREFSDLFLRLNPVCSILGLPVITYQQSREPGPRASRNPATLREGVDRFLRKHRDLVEAHPRGHADVLLSHARMSIVAGPRRDVVPSIVRAFRVAPRHTAGVVLNPLRTLRLLLTLRISG
jgi:glycosyltransferase involved in cell wall biosynthesis